MCDFRSRKRLHEADSFLDGSLLPLSSGMDESGSLFHHGEVGMGNSTSMMSSDLCPGSSMETADELRQLLICATFELETARDAASAQGKLHEARVRHLEELLRKTTRERDEAREQCHQLQGRLSRSPSRNGSALVDNATVNAAVEADFQQKQILEELQKHLELQEHSMTSSHIQMVQHQDQHMEENHHLSPPHSHIMSDMNQLNAQSPESHSSLHPSSQMQSPENHYTMSGLHHVSSSSDLHQLERQGSIHFNTINEQETDHLLSHKSLHQQVVQKSLPPISVKRNTADSPSRSTVIQQHQDSPSNLSVRRHRETPLALSGLNHRDSPTAMQQHRDSPSTRSFIQRRESPCISMSVMQHPAWQAVPGENHSSPTPPRGYAPRLCRPSTSTAAQRWRRSSAPGPVSDPRRLQPHAPLLAASAPPGAARIRPPSDAQIPPREGEAPPSRDASRAPPPDASRRRPAPPVAPPTSRARHPGHPARLHVLFPVRQHDGHVPSGDPAGASPGAPPLAAPDHHVDRRCVRPPGPRARQQHGPPGPLQPASQVRQDSLTTVFCILFLSTPALALGVLDHLHDEEEAVVDPRELLLPGVLDLFVDPRQACSLGALDPLPSSLGTNFSFFIFLFCLVTCSE